ncbi:MAG: hypothetical protein AAGJ12_12380 [Bacteroidota bacterium]
MRISWFFLVPVGSKSDLTYSYRKGYYGDKVSAILVKDAQTDSYQNVLATNDTPIFYSDIVKNTYASTVDFAMTLVVHDDLLKALTR